jgi:hypothetical protein
MSHVDTDAIMRNAVVKHQVILGTVNAGKEECEAASRALGVIARCWPGLLQALITTCAPLAAYRNPLLGRSSGIKRVRSFAPTRARGKAIKQASACM